MSGNTSRNLKEENKRFTIVAAVSLNEIRRTRSFKLFVPCYSGVILRFLSRRVNGCVFSLWTSYGATIEIETGCCPAS